MMAANRSARPRLRQTFGRRGWCAWVTIAATACQSLVDPALPATATRLVPPPVYARWWAMTEACSGLRGDLAAVTWYVATGAPSVSDGHERDLAGYWSRASNRIVLADTAGLTGAEIRHEMLHALERQRGHSRAQFLGRCAGTVACVGACITDAGPPPSPDPAAVPVTPSALRVAGVVDPVSPTAGAEGGWFTFTVLVSNSRATPVVVALRPSGDAGPPASYSWDATCLGRCPVPGGGTLGGVFSDARADYAASVTRFAAGETKRVVVDFRVGGRADGPGVLPAGPYAFTGFYGGRHAGGAASAPVTVVVGP